MTDPSERPPDGVEGRVERYFAAEVSRAERDVRRGWTARPVPAERRVSRPHRTVALLTTLAVAVILVVGSATFGAGWFARPTPSSSSLAAAPSSSPTSPPPSSSAVGSAVPVVDSSYPDGLPSSIGGEPVLRPADAIAHAAATTDRTPFLVGGWVSEEDPSVVPAIPPEICYGLCPTPGQPSLDRPTLGDEPGGRELWGRILQLGRLHLAANQAVVVRVHIADPDSAGCAGVRVECASTMVPESIVWADGQLMPGTYPDGIPMAVDGQPVWRPGDVPAHLASVVDDTPFLIGGTYSEYVSACAPQVSPAPPSSPLLPRCHGAIVSDGGGIAAATVRVVPMGGIDRGRSVVLRVHTHDPLSVTCSALVEKACEAAVVVEAVVWSAPAPPAPPIVDGRYPDGLPSSLDGQPVLRADAAHARAQAATEPSSFLVGGWSRGAVAYSCPFLPADPTPEPMLPRCGDTVLDDVPLPGPSTANLMVIDPGSPLRLQPGLVVLRVHVRDPRAETCAPADLAACRDAFVFEAVAWQGDASTTTVPLTIQDVALRLQQIWPDLWLVAGRGDELAARLAGCAVPAVIWRGESEPPSMAPTDSMTILVYPTTERAGSAPGLAPPASCPSGDGVIRVRSTQDNVVILSWGKVSATELDRLRAALKVDLRAPRY